MLVQFHPSYTYEDFVRGIIAESKENYVKYTNVNKVLGEFAEKALKNFNASTTNAPESSINEWIDEKFEDFKNNIQAKLPEEETKLSGDTITIFEVRDDHFKYAKNWQTPGYLKFSEFKNLVRAILQNEIKLTSAASDLDKDKFLHAHYRYTYYNALLVHFFGIYKYEEKKKEIIDTKNYVLLIDEINRANLSSVLGELIYALEYRGEAVESMYEVDGENKLILPPNLYIIGTMNTADRSVGHIDYAIRRRFAFVNVLPKDLTSELQDKFMLDKFNQVASLFVKDYDSELDYNDYSISIERSEHLTHDFDPKDVWLGHSYFIKQYEKDVNGDEIEENPIDFNLRIKYEIKPILEEYIKDGILKETAREVINTL
ncbi:AAA family ATPase [Myroides odoratimimus]|nr:AAA family ATPase [Myroides odoratimimus]MDM1677195.1 AAA family ATPase [Myroides odoratimimus]